MKFAAVSPVLGLAALYTAPCLAAAAESAPPFDGRPWNISTGNLSVGFIQASPIGALPKPDFFEAPPSVESQVHLRNLGLVANEDYIAWGAVEREPGQWSWRQHDAMEQTLHKAGLKYVAYTWVHFPPVWLRDRQPENRTLMRCLEHEQDTSYLSIFDPATIQWYDHFYRNLRDHFGNRIDGVYACILGPYGEGNYPIQVRDWVNMGHCHEGYWCGDRFAVAAFRGAMKNRYRTLAKLNRAWNASYRSFDDVLPPALLSTDSFKPSPAAFPTPAEKRRWLDFITWYHQAIIDFAGQSLRTVLKYFPAEKVRMKPGGSSGGVNRLCWGTYCPGYAKMAQPFHGVVLQPADFQGAVFADKWVGTAYQFYGVMEGTEPAGGLSDKDFVRRIFSDASCGASQLFSYEFEQHAADIRKYAHLLTGKPGETEIAVFCPTTLYWLGGDLGPTIRACTPLRDLCEFDVLDELLISDGALTTKRYRVLLMFQADIVEQPVLDKINAFIRAGGKVIAVGDSPIRNVQGKDWPGANRLVRVASVTQDRAWLKELSVQFAGCKGFDGQLDGLWTCCRSNQVFVYNSTGKAAETKVDGRTVTVAPNSIWCDQLPSNSTP